MQKVVRFRAFELQNNELIEGIEKISSPGNLQTCSGRIFVQISDKDRKTITEVKEKLYSKAKQFFDKGEVGQNGEDLRGFLVSGFSSRIYSPQMMKQLIDGSVLSYGIEDLSKISTQNFINILETCVFNGMLDSSGFSKLVAAALEKIETEGGRGGIGFLSNIAISVSYFHTEAPLG